MPLSDPSWSASGWASPESWQWQQTLTAHDPNPPITLEEPPPASSVPLFVIERLALQPLGEGVS